MGLSGKVTLVTGGSRGVGRAIFKRLAADGALVAVNYAGNSETAASVVAEIESAGGSAFALQAKLGTAVEMDKLFAALGNELVNRGKSNYLDILVNNAGIGHFGKVSEATGADFDKVFTANVKAPFLISNLAARVMGNGGRIVNISSGASRRPGTLLGLYAMSKGALNVMTVALAAELGARGITVNAVAPGWAATEVTADIRRDTVMIEKVVGQQALGRLGASEDVANAVALLASEDSGWITGQFIETSGGFRSF